MSQETKPNGITEVQNERESDVSEALSSSEAQVKIAKSEKPPKGSIIMSGMRTTGRLHIGNYFGALKNWIELQNDYMGYYGCMDWHAMTTSYKAANQVTADARDMFAEVLAFGLDPAKNVIFIQSQVPEHLELFAMFLMITPMGWAERVPTWKDAEADAKASDTHNLGRFSYPILQAADIAVYQASHVPIGHDQIAHLELTREIVRRFNHLYGAKIPEPRPVFTETPTLLGTDGRKMSKSYGNTFFLLQEEDELTKTLRATPTDPARVKRTDPGEPTKCPVYAFHKLFSPASDLPWVENGCRTAAIGCGDCKKKLGENINGLMAIPREKKKELLRSPDTLDSIIADGCQRARLKARETLDHVKSWTGFKTGPGL